MDKKSLSRTGDYLTQMEKGLKMIESAIRSMRMDNREGRCLMPASIEAIEFPGEAISKIRIALQNEDDFLNAAFERIDAREEGAAA